MVLDQMNAVVPGKPLMDTAWTILEAANDLGARATVEICRRVIDVSLRGQIPTQSDMDTILNLFE